jgi:hypothetical protein
MVADVGHGLFLAIRNDRTGVSGAAFVEQASLR